MYLYSETLSGKILHLFGGIFPLLVKYSLDQHNIRWWNFGRVCNFGGCKYAPFSAVIVNTKFGIGGYVNNKFLSPGK